MWSLAVSRKNYLFAGNDAGGETAAVLDSLVGTCRRVGLDSFTYLRGVFNPLPAQPAAVLDDLLPARLAVAPDA